MTRRIVCQHCYKGKSLPPEDTAMGWLRRAVHLAVVAPKNLGIRLNGVWHPLAELHCDFCNAALTGEIAVAETMWNTNREGVPRSWETQYGTILPAEAADLANKLSSTETTTKK